MAEIKAWQSMSREGTQNLVKSMGSKLQVVIDQKELACKYKQLINK